MRHTFLLSLVGMVSVTLVACAARQTTAQASAPATSGESGPHTGVMGTGAAGTNAAAVGSTTGKVTETMNAGPYTYVQVDDGTKKIWAAAPQFTVAVGDTVVVPEGAPMPNFYSKTLNRTFDLVYFVGGIKVIGGKSAKGPVAKPHGGAELGATDGTADQVAVAHGAAAHGGAGHGAAGGHGAPGSAAPNVALDFSNIQKADGGHTVAELFANKAALAGKEVVVRGRVAKFTPEVMGKNWIHLQDGTGSAGTNDLTVATSATAAVGNLVLVRGKLTTDRDLGFGYHYDVIIDDAAVTVE